MNVKKKKRLEASLNETFVLNDINVKRRYTKSDKDYITNLEDFMHLQHPLVLRRNVREKEGVGNVAVR